MNEELLAPLLLDVSANIAAHANGHTSLDELDDDGRAAVLEGARRLAEAMEPDEQLLFRVEGGAYAADSPHTDWPGRIVFPEPKGGVYTRIMNALKPREGDPEIDPRNYFPKWRVAVTICDLEIAGLDSLDFDDVRGEVLAWAADCVDEYYSRFFLSDRLRRVRSGRA